MNGGLNPRIVNPSRSIEGGMVTPVLNGNMATPALKRDMVTPVLKGSLVTPVLRGSTDKPVQKAEWVPTHPSPRKGG